jgi:DNA replication initiation complex subunit (GINS family)
VQRFSKGGLLRLYDELYEMWKREKENEIEIQHLPKNFYTKIVSYIKQLTEENRMLDKKTTKSKLLDIEFKNVKVMINELFFLRQKKIRKKTFAVKTVPRGNLTEEERKLYDEILPLFEAYNNFSKDTLRGCSSSIKKNSKQTAIILRFIHEIPALVGADMKTYGPFNPEDIANLPVENAQILIDQGIAVKVDIT